MYLKMTMSKKRNPNIELLRILSMIMIVYSHYSTHSNWDFPDYFSKRTIIATYFSNFGKIGVIIFILITGYFYSQQDLKLKKILHLSNIARFYSILSLILVVLIANGRQISIPEIIKSIFPISFNNYWFLTLFTIILLLNPILKPFLLSQNRRKKLKITSLLIIVVHIPFLIGFLSQTDDYFSPSLELAFIYTILVGDLIKCYEHELLTRYFKYVVLSFFFSLSLITYRCIFYQPFLLEKLPKIPNWFLIGSESINALIFGCATFILIKKIKLTKVKTILFLSPVVFDVYLIHDNNYMRPFIWQVIFPNKSFFNSPYLLAISFLEPIVVFSLCIALALLRQKLFEIIKLILSKYSHVKTDVV